MGSFQDEVFNFTTTVPYFQLNLYLPSKNFTAVLTYLDVPNFSILCAPSLWSRRNPSPAMPTKHSACT